MLIETTRDTKFRNFVSMAVQGTQVPIYTNTHCFLYFSHFSKKNLKNKITNKQKLKTNKQKQANNYKA